MEPDKSGVSFLRGIVSMINGDMVWLSIATTAFLPSSPIANIEASRRISESVKVCRLVKIHKINPAYTDQLFQFN